ncbi:MAG TPA: hypothetical protein DC054_09365 [Blastocatellia bacterium]|nr:hypothetical protein [Blastocatellia bacterium]
MWELSQQIALRIAFHIPLAGFVVYFLYWTLKTARMEHTSKMLISCSIAAVVLTFIRSSPGNRIDFEILGWIVVWYFVGEFLWGRKQRKSTVSDSLQPKQPDDN